MARKTKYDSYKDAFKATAVVLGALPGVQAKDVAEVLDIHPITLYRWKREYRDGDIMMKQTKAVLDTETRVVACLYINFVKKNTSIDSNIICNL